MVNGQVYHFAARGLYDGQLLLGDRESGSFWCHLTGECVHGPLKGYHREVFPLLRMTVGQALTAYPGAQVAVSKLTTRQRVAAWIQSRVLWLLGNRLPPGFKRTMGEEDLRRPRMEIGLAVWTGRVQRFYSLQMLRGQGGAIIDVLDGRQLLVYLDPISGTPACLYTDASQCVWQHDVLHLDTGEVTRMGVLFDARGETKTADRPKQSIVCWYAYAFTFPGGEIYEG